MLYNLVYVHYNLKLRNTPINLNYIFWKDFADEWVSQRTPLLDQDFLKGAVANMNDNVNVVVPSEGDMVVDMDIDYDKYEEEEDEEQDNKETDGTVETDWQYPVVEKWERAQHDKVPDV
ncbi:hypothetical protein AMTRI_Chr11g153280 [Amborella trichopoda]